MPCDASSTVSSSGQRVASMRARRSSRSASGVSIVNGRIAVASVDFSATTDMWLLTVVVLAQTVEVSAYKPAECWSRKITLAEALGRSAYPPYTRTRHGANCGLESMPTAEAIGSSMGSRDTEHLRVLIPNEREDRLALVAPIVTDLGHEVIAREVDVQDVGGVTAGEHPDVALVG